jgi:hypothetical protein
MNSHTVGVVAIGVGLGAWRLYRLFRLGKWAQKVYLNRQVKKAADQSNNLPK